MAKLSRRRRRRRRSRLKDGAEGGGFLRVTPRVTAAKASVEGALKAARGDGPDAKALETAADRAATHALSKGPGAAGLASTATAPAGGAQAKGDPAASAPKGGAGAGGGLGVGSALPQTQKTRFSGPLGDSLDGVRIDTSGQAARLTKALGAKALTIGKRIGFAPGAYAPDTRDGAHLLAHELAHTVQQKRGAARGPQRKSSEEAKHGHPGVEGGLLHDSARARMNLYVKKGETLTTLAQRLLPIWLTAEASLSAEQRAAIPGEIRTATGLAKALLVHHQSYLLPPDMAPWQDGLRLPLPALRDPEDGKLVVNLPLAGRWLSGWNESWAPALTRKAEETKAAEGSGEIDLTRAFLSNPKSALPLAQTLLDPAREDAGQVALSIMDMLVNHQVETLSASPEGKAIFSLIEAAIDRQKAGLDPRAVSRAQKMLTGVRAVDEATARSAAESELAVETGNCMTSCYIRIEALLGSDKRKAIEEAVARKNASDPHTDLDHVITMMEMMEAEGSAGAPFVMEQTYGTEDWSLHPDSVIETILNQNEATRGYYFFGLSVATGYHSVMMMLSNRDPANPILLLMDQTGQFKGGNFYGRLASVLEEYAVKARTHDPNYNKFVSKIWPIYPRPGTMIKLE